MDTAFARNAASFVGRDATGQVIQGWNRVQDMISPEGIAEQLEAAVFENRFYCLTYDTQPKEFFKEVIRARFEDILEERPP